MYMLILVYNLVWLNLFFISNVQNFAFISEISKFIPEQEITIPNDGNVSKFTVEELTTFLKHMGTSDRIVNHLRKKNVDGKRFSKLSDSELETVGINNPIIMYFRDRSTKSKKSIPFML